LQPSLGRDSNKAPWRRLIQAENPHFGANARLEFASRPLTYQRFRPNAVTGGPFPKFMKLRWLAQTRTSETGHRQEKMISGAAFGSAGRAMDRSWI
jgi:hypothetical protein